MRVFTTKIRRVLEAKTRRRDGSKKELAAVAERMAEDVQPILVLFEGVAIQFPNDLALSLIRRRRVKLIADPGITPTLVIDEDDIEESNLGAALWGGGMVAA